MKCGFCGKEISDDVKFCGYCGKEVSTKGEIVRVCPKCGFKTTEDQRYCDMCGTLLKVELPDFRMASSGKNDEVIRKYSVYSLYYGEPSVGVSKATGTLVLFNDRLELKKFFGNAASGMFGTAGAIISYKMAKKKDFIKYYSDIAEVRVGKYGGVYNTVVIVMSDGDVFSLCPPIPASNQPYDIVKLINTRINKTN